VVISALAVSALGASYLVAVQDPVPRWELNLTESINGVSDVVATMLYPVMQLGTVWSPLGVGAMIWFLRRDSVLAVATALAGVITWFGAKGVKQLVERGRPLQYIPSLDVREGAGTGLGYISGHSAVAATTAVMAMSVMPRRSRPTASLLAGLVGIGRIVYGAHLPADVVGGWAFGTLIGIGTLEGIRLIRISGWR
jgi:undecaprenyl-diphosphatase